MMSTRVRLGFFVVGVLAAAGLAGCGGANPVALQASVVAQGLTAGSEVQVQAALAAADTTLRAYQIEHGSYPADAEAFAGVPAPAAPGVRFGYVATADGFCLTATSSVVPPLTRVWR